MYPNVYSIIYNSQAMEAKGPSKDEWLKRKWCIYTTEYYSAIKKNEILLFVATQMHLEGIMLNKINKTEKDKYCMLSLICEI